MKTSQRVVAFVLGAGTLAGCAATAQPSSQVRMRTTTAAFQGYANAQETRIDRVKRSGKESPRVHACKTGSSKVCNELGDGLAIKHAPTEARVWYVTACERVRTSMLPNATRLMYLNQEIVRAEGGESGPAAGKRLAELRSDASEIKARIQGCLDAGESLKTDSEFKQSLRYLDAVCEFSTLVDSVYSAAPSLENMTDSACSAGAQARARLGELPFEAQLFAELVKPKAKPASNNASEGGMVFTEGDL